MTTWVLIVLVAICGLVLVSALLVDLDSYFRASRELKRLDDLE